jgi:hypothetical protein
MTSEKETACDRRLAYYREKLGRHWANSDETMFRAAWAEGAAAAREQLRAEDGEFASVVADANGAELERLRQIIDRLDEYANTFGKDLVPSGPDSYGEGVRAVKRTVKAIIAKGLAK